MTLSVILDTDFLSAFLKIERLSLVKDFYQVEFLLIPSAVYSELSVTSLGQTLAKLPWIQVEAPPKYYEDYPAEIDAWLAKIDAQAVELEGAR